MIKVTVVTFAKAVTVARAVRVIRAVTVVLFVSVVAVITVLFLPLILPASLFGPGNVAMAVQVEGGTTRVNTVARGEVLEATLTLRNDTAVPEHVRLYMTDYIQDARLGWRFPAAGTLDRSNALWVELTETEVLLQPGEVRNVLYRVFVPDSPDVRGTYWGSFMIEPQSFEDISVLWESTSEELVAEDHVDIVVRQVFRYQIALITNVGTTGKRALAFVEPALEAMVDGSVAFRVFIENVGERWLNPDVWLEVYDETGQRVRRIAAGRPHILPGSADLRVFDLTGINSGEYVALLLVDDGDDAVFGTRFTLRFTSD